LLGYKASSNLDKLRLFDESCSAVHPFPGCCALAHNYQPSMEEEVSSPQKFARTRFQPKESQSCSDAEPTCNNRISGASLLCSITNTPTRHNPWTLV
jgi:hypothetical protein